MRDFDHELKRRIEEIKSRGLHRTLRTIQSPQSTAIKFSGRDLLNFSSNDYLGLANHPALKQAAGEAVGRYGAGSGASRLICGSLAPHQALEAAIAEFKRMPAAITFSSGYSTALGTICALMGKEDVVVLDRLVHACIVDAARLSGATLRVFPHNDLNQLEKILQWCDRTAVAGPSSGRHVLVVTESVFSMDGDHAPLKEMVALKEKYGAWLMVDEAHATGLYGSSGRGLSEQKGVANQIEVHMGTLGKALGSAGGYVCGSEPLVELLVNRARSFIFSTAPIPAAAAAACAGIRVIGSAEGDRRRATLWENVAQLTSALDPESGSRSVRGASTVSARKESALAQRSAIIPVHMGLEQRATEAASALLDRGLFVPAIRYPTVARGRARLRITLTADHTRAEIEALLQALDEVPSY